MTVIDAGLVESLRVDDQAERPQAEVALYQRIAVDWQRRGVLSHRGPGDDSHRRDRPDRAGMSGSARTPSWSVARRSARARHRYRHHDDRHHRR